MFVKINDFVKIAYQQTHPSLLKNNKSSKINSKNIYEINQNSVGCLLTTKFKKQTKFSVKNFLQKLLQYSYICEELKKDIQNHLFQKIFRKIHFKFQICHQQQQYIVTFVKYFIEG
eukprot:TRINITY_DN9376_c0_g2_i1.p2 TRINITY_DN9376_c0_g2~~TRINITY_DN9376_c0_g2_i1.p2  ORF type:complete len:116 (-),score=4.30 TRINITY_DN9376_c0_g2_i1:578-925(-)